MSDQLHFNDHGLRLITQFEGAPRLKARLCEGGRFELSYGVTFYPDGSPVEEGDTCTHDEAMAMFRHALSVFEDAVRRNVKVPMNSNQFSAYVVFCYNVGEAQFASSTVLRRINERRYDDAAEAMGAWIYATLGQHKQALRGLARRQYATGCLAMGYDWEVACSDDAIALVRERPPNDIGTDRVLFKTKFTDVLTVAQRYPLPPLDDELVLTTPAPSPRAADEAAQQPANPARNPAAGAAPAIEKPVSNGPAPATPPAKIPAPQRAPEGSVLPSQKVDAKPPEKPPIIAPQPINPNQLPTNTDTSKNMADSTRMIGMVIVGIGSVIQIISVRLGVGTAIGAVAFDLSRDPTVIALTVTAIIAAFGWVTKALGKKTFAKGADKAQGNLY